jgi:uncharacterized membrane protein YccC
VPTPLRVAPGERTVSTSWRPLVRAAVHVDFDRIELGGALRCTVGVVIPLVVGLASGAVSEGVAAAVGALCAGFASFQGAYRSRAWLTLAVAAGMSVSTVVGAAASHDAVSAVVVTAAWAAMAGMLGALGQGALVTGMQWVVAVLIVGVIPMTFSQALLRAAAILVGGVIQTLLVVVLWPFGTSVVERRALQTAYVDLAGYAEQVAGGAELASGAASLNSARDALGDPQPFSNAGRLLAFQGLVDEAERLRIEIVALARHRSRLSPAAETALVEILSAAAVVLRCVARSLSRDEEPRVPPDTRAGLSGCESLRAVLRGGDEPTWLQREVVTAADALAGQLRSAIRLATVSAGRPDPIVDGRDLPMRRHVVVRNSMATLRANASWRSTSFRHALRLGVTVGLATVIYRASGLSHGYWIPLTALVVLRPDYASTTLRGLSRVVGTIIGAAIATLLAALIRPDQVGLAILFTGASFAAFIVLRANYAAFSTAVTSYVVFLLAFVKLPEMTAVSDRILSTLIGGALAIGAYLAWPTWESRLIGPQLATVLDAQADYMAAVLAVWIDPRADRSRLGDLRSTTRLARSNAEASLDRLLAEPARSLRSGMIATDQVRGVVAAAGSISLAILSLHAQLPPEGGTPCAEAAPLELGVAGRARSQADHLRNLGISAENGRRADGGSMASGLSGRSLRQLHSEMTDELRGRVTGMDDRSALLVAETDLLVDSINVISEVLERPQIDAA